MIRGLERSTRIAWVTALVLSGLTALPLWGSGCDLDPVGGDLRLQLDTDQHRLECRSRDTEDVFVSGQGRIRVTILLETSTDALEQLIINDTRHGKRFRTVLLNPRSVNFELGVTNLEDYPDSFPEIDLSEGTVGDPYEFVIVLERRLEVCEMRATVSGDIAGEYFGDVAYFNTSKEYVKRGMMVGTIGETQTHEEVAGFGTVDVSRDEALSMAARMGFLSEEEAEEAAQDGEDAEEDGETTEENEEPEGEAPGFAAWAREELRADDPSEGDNFGLNLTDLKGDVEFESNAGAGAMLAGGFTFTLSGRVDISEFDVGPQQDEAPRLFTVTPSTITATVGLSDEGDRIPFEMPEGGQVSGTIGLEKEDLDFILGSFVVGLETKGVYTLESWGPTRDGVTYNSAGVAISPRKLKIQVAVEFAARRGSLSCMQ
jgi:hypothetical protein